MNFLKLVYENIKISVAVIIILGFCAGVFLPAPVIQAVGLALALVAGAYAAFYLVMIIPTIVIFFTLFIFSVMAGAGLIIGFSAIWLALALTALTIIGWFIGLIFTLAGVSSINFFREEALGQ